MEPAPFVAYTIPPEAVDLARMTQEVAGSRLDFIVGPPRMQFGMELYPFRMRGAGLSARLVQGYEERLPSFYHRFRTLFHDEASGVWEAEGLADVRRFEDAGSREMGQVIDRFDLPWIHIEDGIATVRLLPRHGQDAFRLRDEVERILRQAGAPRDVEVHYMDRDEYGLWKRRMAEMGA